jgi:GT2 family glycosyltransferase
LISVVIPNWNGAGYIGGCLDSIAKQTYRDFGVCVVDNGSTDGSDALVEGRYSWVNLIRLPRNVGFAGGVNRGIAATSGELVAIVNMDAQPDPGWLAALARACEQFPEAGSFACLVLGTDEEGRIESAGDVVSLSGTASHRWNGDLPEDHVLDEPKWVFGACGAAAAYRRSALEEVGLFEESFFAQFEDVDLAFRLLRARLPCLFVPDAIVRHAGYSTITTPSRRAWAVRLSHRNQIWMIARNFPRRLLAKHWRDIAAAQARGLASAFIHRRAGPAWAVVLGKAAGLLGLARCLAWRSKSLARHPGPDSLADLMAPPIAYQSLASTIRSLTAAPGDQGRDE